MKRKQPSFNKNVDRQRRFDFYRRLVGASLTELLIASLLIGFTTALVGELVVTTTTASVKNNNQSNMLGTAKVCGERLMSDIQLARCVGDYYGQTNPTSELNTFPNPSNPLYGSGGMQPDGGWPSAPWPSYPYQLGAQCLIVQQPVFYCAKENSTQEPTYNPNAPQSHLNGFPMRIKGSQITDGVPSAPVENLDTVVYQVVADSAKPGEYILQMARFPGYRDPLSNTHYEPAVNPPQTIATGIVGPKLPGDPTGPPHVFKYIKHDPTYGVTELSDAELLDDLQAKHIAGVAIDLEFKKSESTSTSATADTQNLGVHTEAFLKNNRLVLRNNGDD